MQLPLPDRRVDVAFAFWSVETLADPAAGLREMVRFTRPGGWIAVAFRARCRRIDWIDRCFQAAIAICRSGRMLDPPEAREHMTTAGATDIRQLHCRGPARLFIGRKEAGLSLTSKRGCTRSTIRERMAAITVCCECSAAVASVGSPPNATMPVKRTCTFSLRGHDAPTVLARDRPASQRCGF